MKVEVKCYHTDMQWAERELPLHACSGCGDFFEIRAVPDRMAQFTASHRDCCRAAWQAGMWGCPTCGENLRADSELSEGELLRKVATFGQHRRGRK